jgi:hypothetical protein
MWILLHVKSGYYSDTKCSGGPAGFQYELLFGNAGKDSSVELLIELAPHIIIIIIIITPSYVSSHLCEVFPLVY